MSVASLKSGEKGIVRNAEGGFGIMKKLEAMGIRPGVVITKISDQFLNGPVIIRVGAAELAIGRGIARKIMINKIIGEN